MAKRFYLSKKQNIKLVIPEKHQHIFGVSCLQSKTDSDLSDSVAVKNVVKRKSWSRFEFNLFIRMLAFTLMFCSLAVLCDYSAKYMEDIELNNAIKKEYEVNFIDKYEVYQNNVERPVPVYPLSGNEDGSSKYNYPIIDSIDGIKKLEEKYEDFVYWLHIDNTPISYTVVQADDNDYYLRRNINGETNLSGTLFLDYRNEPEMEHGNNIIYGHNMQNGTMFGGLKKYNKKDFFDKHQMIYTYTSKTVTAWKIFSVYETTTENYYIQTNFINDENYYEFISGLQRSSKYQNDVVLDSSSTVLTLSTCHKYDYANGRFVVHAVKMFSTPIS